MAEKRWHETIGALSSYAKNRRRTPELYYVRYTMRIRLSLAPIYHRQNSCHSCQA